ncbi:MAG: hypothetical protein M3Y07_06545 [Acidobacteriota bacterium]|nr:hypothetical protein [Acidobacteriota bacterium]
MNVKNSAVAVILIGATAPFLYGDFTYQSTGKITGGALVGMMKLSFAGAFSKDARKVMDPISSTTSIKGNRMVTKAADSSTVVDIDKETITTVNLRPKNVFGGYLRADETGDGEIMPYFQT